MMKNDKNETSCTFVLMNDISRQSHASFKAFLSKMNEGFLDNGDVEFIFGGCLDFLPQEEQYHFSHSLYLTPSWNMRLYIYHTVYYLTTYQSMCNTCLYPKIVFDKNMFDLAVPWFVWNSLVWFKSVLNMLLVVVQYEYLELHIQKQ